MGSPLKGEGAVKREEVSRRACLLEGKLQARAKKEELQGSKMFIWGSRRTAENAGIEFENCWG